MQFIVILIVTCVTIALIIETYKVSSLDENEKLIKNLEQYAKKEKIKQQESKILGQKQVKRKDNKKKRTRMYHI